MQKLLGRKGRRMKVSKAVYCELGFLGVLLVLGLIFGVNTLFAADQGLKVFKDTKCQTCHGIESLGVQSGYPDLSTAGKEHTADFIAKYITKNESLNGKKHKAKFKGSDEELKALSEWLGNLKSDKAQMTPQSKKIIASFKKSKCTKCHGIKSFKVVGGPPDLSTVGKKHKADWFSQYLKKQVKLNGKKHQKSFKGSDGDLAALSQWLESLK